MNRLFMYFFSSIVHLFYYVGMDLMKYDFRGNLECSYGMMSLTQSAENYI